MSEENVNNDMLDNEVVPCEPVQQSQTAMDSAPVVQDPTHSAAATENDLEADGKKNSANFDPARCLKLTGLPTSLSEESPTAFTDAVVEIFNKTFGIPSEAIEKVVRFPVKAGSDAVPQEAAVQALIAFRSRVHKHRVFTQRTKIEAPMSIDQVNEWPGELTAAQEDEILASSGDFVVCDEVGEDMDENAVLGVDSKPNGNEAGILDASGNSTAGQVKTNEEEHPEVDENGEPIKEEDGDKKDDKKKPNEPVIDWDGAPEFQWKTTVQTEDRFKLILDNVSLGDFDNPWLYQTIMRAKHIDFNCINTTFKGNFDHNPLRKGRLTLTFHSDNQAMAQAVNGLVCLRTRPNKRLKIFLPQTNTTLRMKGLLERKLGRVVDTNTKSRQLLVRGIGEEITEEEIKAKLALRVEDVEKVEIRDDSLERRCAIVTFVTPEVAIRAHMKNDEVRLGPKGKAWTRVFYMQDIVAGPLLTKTEAKHATNKRQPKGKDDSAAKKADGAKAGEAAEAVVNGSSTETAAGATAAESNAAEPTEATAAADQKLVKEEPTKQEKGEGEKDNRKRGRSRSPGRQRKRGRGPPRASAVAAAKISFVGPTGRGGLSTARGGRGSPRGGGYRSSYEQRGGSFARGYSNSPMNQAPRASPWANGPPGARAYGNGMGGGAGGYRENSMDVAIREQREQLAMQQQILQQQEYISELAGELRKRKTDVVGYSNGGAGGGGGGYAPIGRQPYQTPGMGSRIAPAMNSRAAAQPADYPPRGYGQMDRGYAPAAPHRPYGNPQPQQSGGYGPWTR